MRISRRVDLNAYLRTLVQLADHGITETMLPPSFYKMHWSERKRYLAHAYDLFMCPRCRNICTPASKHQFRELCQKCGGHTKHRITVVPDDELLDAPQLGASIPETSTEEQDTDIYPEPGTFTDVPLNMDMLLGKVNQTNKDPLPQIPARRLETVDEIVTKLRKKDSTNDN